MNYTIYGKTQERVSWLGMGGMRFDKNLSEEDCIKTIRYANDCGVNYFDTAPQYNEDRSESIYGRAFAQMQRDKFKVTTKAMNYLSAKEVEESIELSLKRFGLEYIDFFFLWCVMHLEQYEKSKLQGGAIEGILRAKERGLIQHIGVSTHTYSADIKTIADDELFEFIMVPYNALNFAQREEGLRYAKAKGLGTVVMNPLYGGVIANYKDKINIYPDSNNSTVEDALKFCYESPFIDVTLAGMNSIAMVKENIKYLKTANKISSQEQDLKQQQIQNTFSGMCTSCGYCLKHCPQKIDIKSYMENYNTYFLTHDLAEVQRRHKWFRNFGPLLNTPKAEECIRCEACEKACTQYLDIINRLEWLEKECENQ